jgi:acyl-CoA dehydrogenase
MTNELTDNANRLFAASLTAELRQSAATGTFPQALWDEVTEAGFPAALLPEDAGGFGLSVAEAMTVLQTSAFHAAPIPLAETMLAGWLLARAGLEVPPGVLTLAPVRLADHLTLTHEAASPGQPPASPGRAMPQASWCSRMVRKAPPWCC